MMTNDNPKFTAIPGCVAAALFGCIVYALIFLAVRARADSTGDHWICQSSAIYSFAPGAIQAEWDGESWRVLETHDPANPADDTWQNWTGDESVIELGIMYANPDLNEQGPAYIDYLDRANGLIWRFAFIDLIPTDEGGRPGHHHSCPQGPVVYDLEHH
jgi:hypothetical protein